MEVRQGTIRHDQAILFRSEDIFDACAEESSDPKGERQTGVVLFVLKRVHRLTRDLKSVGELALRPVAFRAQNAKAVLHRYRYAAIAPPMPQSAIINGKTQM